MTIFNSKRTPCSRRLFYSPHCFVGLQVILYWLYYITCGLMLTIQSFYTVAGVGCVGTSMPPAWSGWQLLTVSNGNIQIRLSIWHGYETIELLVCLDSLLQLSLFVCYFIRFFARVVVSCQARNSGPVPMLPVPLLWLIKGGELLYSHLTWLDWHTGFLDISLHSSTHNM